MNVTLTVNGEARSVDVAPNTLLVELLRNHLGLTGTHVGCDTSQCGACTVHMNGASVKSCTMLAAQAEGARSPRSKASARRSGCIRCRPRFANVTRCNAASARPA